MRLFLTIIFMFVCSIASAETYVLIDSQSKEVYSISPENDAQVETGQEVVILDRNYFELELSQKAVYYKFNNGNLLINQKKIEDENLKIYKEQKEITDKIESKKAARASANAKLKALGLTEEEVEALTN